MFEPSHVKRLGMAAPGAKAGLSSVNGGLDTAASEGAADGADAAGDAGIEADMVGEAPVEAGGGAVTPPGLPEPLAPEQATTELPRRSTAMARCNGDRMRPSIDRLSRTRGGGPTGAWDGDW